MNFVDNINFIASFQWGIFYFFNEFPDFVDAVVGCSVNFHDIGMISLLDCQTAAALIARCILLILAIHRFGQQLGNGRLPGPAGTAEQICMGDFILLYCVFQRRDNVLLTYDFFTGGCSLGSI